MKKKILPNKYKSLIQKAIIFQNSGQFAEARAIYEKLRKQLPGDSQVLYLLGSLYGQMGEFEQCIRYLSESLKANPNQINAHHNLAIAYETTNQLDQAIRSYHHALELSASSPQLHHDLGDLYRKQKNAEKALHHINQSLALLPDGENALINKANLIAETGTYAEAHKAYYYAIARYPNNPVLLNNFSAFLQINDEFKQAEVMARQAIAINPNYPQALSNLGNILIKLESFDEAKQHLQKAVNLNPLFIEAYINLGFLHHNIALFNQALAYFNKAIELSVGVAPEKNIAHWYRTFTLLITGNFEAAWNDYEYRFMLDEHINDPYDFPVYESTPIKNTPLLVTAEQGIGDQVMFVSCLPDLYKQTNHIILECDKRLQPLFKRSFPSVTTIYTGEFNKTSITEKFPDIQQKISIGSLPRLFRNSVSEFPNQSPYLLTDQNKHEKWKNRYRQLGNKLKVGISWQGGTIVEHKKRSMTLASWKDILACDCVFINLQYGDHESEITTFEKKHGIKIHDWEDSDSLKELDDFSAQISALDLVISVGNTNVHLAGSLNVPAWCLIPEVPSWRWLFSGETCIWYPSVYIYRQSDLHDWAPVLKKIRFDLEKRILQHQQK